MNFDQSTLTATIRFRYRNTSASVLITIPANCFLTMMPFYDRIPISTIGLKGYYEARNQDTLQQ
jgi:hypothetical protein